MSNNPNYTLHMNAPSRENVDNFIEGAENKANQFDDPKYPWNAPYVREDMTKFFSVRMPEPLWLKLDYISKVTRKSKHELFMEAFIPHVESELRAIEKQK